MREIKKKRRMRWIRKKGGWEKYLERSMREIFKNEAERNFKKGIWEID